MNYFEDTVHSGKWDEAERYLSGFTKFDDNRYSTNIYFWIRKQNFLEAIDNNCHAKALDILMKVLKVFAEGNEERFKEMHLLLTFENIRDHKALSMCGDIMSTNN
ncbi:putative TOPLESS-related 1 [Prunus yedoensis var. nudiflora]|uniref:Putative TOPLESS-related 1 n=1 Tax=Prunus yedoensis var. nudiflora TaxID=2094558 RepID=A0A314YD20_PRUYE|nr:putative TOPLESS-related 1 [Prunus yedoensis var. nudiflora]